MEACDACDVSMVGGFGGGAAGGGWPGNQRRGIGGGVGEERPEESRLQRRRDAAIA